MLPDASASTPPEHAVYTDGSASPNPGRGGWAAIYVVNNTVIAEEAGYAVTATNNQMELTAIINAGRLVPPNQTATIFTDSQLAVNTLMIWAPKWKERGWKRKHGAIANVSLVRELYRLFQEKPALTLRWTKAHVGHRWNERADRLAKNQSAGTPMNVMDDFPHPVDLKRESPGL